MTSYKSKLECRDPSIGALLVSYALGTLKDTEAEQFEHHLLHCSACQQELEEAGSALETLAAVREQFARRAHEEQEDFRSQFARLDRKAKKTGAEKQRGWAETIWTILWGRRWIIGVAGAVAIAALFFVRYEPETLPFSSRKYITPTAPTPPTALKIGSVADSQMVLRDHGVEKKTESQPGVLPMMEQAEIPDMQARGASAKKAKTPEQAQPIKTESASADMVADGRETMADKLSDKAIRATASHEEQALSVSEKMLYINRDIFPTEELEQIAHIALGEFDPQAFRYPTPKSRAESPAAVSEMSYSLSAKRATAAADEIVVADSLFAGSRFGEARDVYERKWKEDSTDVRMQVMAGISSLAQGDFIRARMSLERAYVKLSQGEQKNDVALLLVRAELLSGRLDEAKNQLQSFIAAVNDPAQKQFAERAITAIDSFKNAHAPKQTPK